MDKKNSKNPFINKFGNKFWRNSKGELHRLDGPSIIFSNGYKCWGINYEELTKEEFNSWKKRLQKYI